MPLKSEDDANHKELFTTIADCSTLFGVCEELFRAVSLRLGKIAGERKRLPASQEKAITGPETHFLACVQRQPAFSRLHEFNGRPS